MKFKPLSSNLHYNVKHTIEKWQKYSEIQKQIKNCSSENIKVSFTDVKYSKDKPFYFPYSLSSAKLILKNCIYYNSVKHILQNHFFSDELNLFESALDFNEEHLGKILNNTEESMLENSKFVALNLSKEHYFKTLKIATWSYSDFIPSPLWGAKAIYFYLETLHSKYLQC